MNKEIIGYIGGVWDLFHIGHITILRNCKALCDKLIVGVTVDKMVSYKCKGKKTVIPFNERIDVIRNIKFVDCAIPQELINKYEIWKRIKFNILFVGDDWYKNHKWKEYENKLKKKGIKIIYFPYTKGTTSTLINQTLERLRKTHKKGE